MMNNIEEKLMRSEAKEEADIIYAGYYQYLINGDLSQLFAKIEEAKAHREACQSLRRERQEAKMNRDKLKDEEFKGIINEFLNYCYKSASCAVHEGSFYEKEQVVIVDFLNKRREKEAL